MNDSTSMHDAPSGESRRRSTVAMIVAATVAVLIIGAATVAWAVAQGTPVDDGPAGSGAAPTSSEDSTASTGPVGDSSCPESTVEVGTSEELESALADARPGEVIQLAPGTYDGRFVMTADGEPDDPITLCGTGISHRGSTTVAPMPCA